VSLRELPPGQKPKAGRWTRIRYVPLIALVCVAAVAIVVGNVSLARTSPPSPSTATPSAGTAAELPATCHPPVQGVAQEPWSGDAATVAKANAIWSAHASDLAHPYVKEKDGWYDWGDIQAANFSQAVGKVTLTAADAAAWNSYLTSVRDKLAAMGIPFYVVFSPAKWDVYPQLLPDWAQQIRGSDSLDLLMAEYPDLPIIDVRNSLRAASAANQTYSKTNAHWTDYGGWVAWNSIAACLTASDPSLVGLSALPITGVQISADQNEFAPFGIADPLPNWTSPIYTTPLKPVDVTTQDGRTASVAGSTPTDLLTLPVSTSTVGAQTNLSALLVRDSFGNALSVDMQQSFARTWQVRHNFDGAADTQPDIPALAQQDHPSVVILQVAERYLDFVPAG
jgi:hypothetical protein